jgi:hypothetical protein
MDRTIEIHVCVETIEELRIKLAAALREAAPEPEAGTPPDGDAE